MRFIPFALAAATLTGCEPIDYGCTDIMMWSVQLELVDEGGAPVAGAVATITDGTITEDCYSDGAGLYTCGSELGGDLTISVQAPGFAAEEIDVTVGSDECHVIPEEITHVMMAVDCTTEAVPSVIVTVSDEDGAAIPDAQVRYAVLDSADSYACEANAADHHCGYEVAGDIEITAEAVGYVSAAEVVSVGVTADGCHVVTESLDLELIAE